MSALRVGACLLAMGLVPAISAAQALRGAVVSQRDSSGVGGVVVLLMDSSGAVVGRALTEPDGAFLLVAPRPGAYRLRTLRVGFRPDTSDMVRLAAGQEGQQHLVLTGVPVQLDTVRVADRSACRAASDGSHITALIWEQARVALQSAQLTARLRSVNATIVTYERRLDPNSERTLEQSSGILSGLTVRPWTSLPPDRLRQTGYVIQAEDGSVSYYAPDLDVLLSPSFVQDHCFRTVRSRDTTLIGVAFEPTRERQDVPELQGTLWLERRSAELRRMEFRYANVPQERSDRAGGEMEFVRMRNGGWAIARWGIRMPVLDHGFRSGGQIQIRVVELHAVGGELSYAVSGRDTLFARAPLVLSGVVLDSSTSAPAAGASIRLAGTTLEARTDERGRFAIPGVVPGPYTLEVRTPAYEVIKAAVQWPLVVADDRTQHQLRIPSVGEIAQARAATLTGVVVEDSTARPIPGADVALPRLGVMTLSDERGAFRLTGIPPGEQEVVVRRVGYGPLNATLHFPERQTVDRRVVLTRLTVLDTVVVEAESPIAEFEEHRKLGLGRFMTRAQLDRLNGQPMAAVLSEVKGAGIFFGRSSHAWIGSTHAAPSERVEQGIRLAQRLQIVPTAAWLRSSGFLPPNVWCPDDNLMAYSQGMKCGCYAQVWLDRMLLNPGEPTPPFDVNSISPDLIEAVEFYSNPAQTPMRYQARNGTCGVLVLHRRRSFDKKPSR